MPSDAWCATARPSWDCSSSSSSWPSAVLAPFIAPYGPNEGTLADRLQPPSREHIMGTDLQGRDEFSRVLYGAQVSLDRGPRLGRSWACLIGGTIGALAGGLGGKVDAVLMRVVDVMLAIPGILLAIGIVALLDRGLPQIMFAVAVVNVPIFARILRGSLLSLREADYVTAARSLGAPGSRLLLRHMLPEFADAVDRGRPRWPSRRPSSTWPASASWASARPIRGPRSGARC